jgi:hypothetical protein
MRLNVFKEPVVRKLITTGFFICGRKKSEKSGIKHFTKFLLPIY